MSYLLNTIRKNSAGTVFKRRRFNFIEGSGVTLTIADDSGNDEVDITIASSGSVTYGSPVSIDIGDAAADGVASTVARSDHQHQFAAPGAGYPQDVRRGTAEADGTATTPARSDHVHTYVSASFDADVQLSRLDQMAAPTASVNLNSQKITNLLDPTSAQDAATKAYVDATAAGIDWKASVRVATTAAGTLATSFENGDTVDGVVLATGDRILIKDQAAGAENGIYTVNASGAPTRATDANTSAEMTSGVAVFVEEGTTNADTGWVLTTNNPITLGTTALTFTQFTSLGQITAGAGLTKTGSTIDVVAADGSITVAADAISVTFASPTGAIDIGDAAAAGSNASAARSDHQHQFSAPGASYPVDVAATEADGSATTPARSDHRHAHGTLYVGSHIKAVTATKTTTYTVTTADEVVPCDATSAAFTVTLPAISGITGYKVTIKKIDSSANAVTVDGNGSETIDGALTYVLSNQYDSVDLVAYSGGWLMV